MDARIAQLGRVRCEAGLDITDLGWQPSAFSPERVFVERITNGSWAERKGLRQGDELLEVGGFSVQSMTKRQFKVAMRQRPLVLHFQRFSTRAAAEATCEVPRGERSASVSKAHGTASTASRTREAPTRETPRHTRDHGSTVGPSDVDAETSPKDAEDPPLARGGFPVRRVGEEDLSQAWCGECTICLCDYAVGDYQLTLPCFHRFHFCCAEQWLERSTECPICKHPTTCNSFQ